MNRQDAIETLLKYEDKTKFFNNLENFGIEVLLKNVNFKKYTRHEVIFSQGEHGDNYIYYILKGYVNIRIKDTSNTPKKIATLHSSSLLGEMKPILDEGRTATCVAGNSGTITIGFKINHDGIQQNPKAYAKFSKNMAFILAQKLKDSNENFRKYRQ